MVLFLLEEDAHLDPVDGEGNVHQPLRLAFVHAEPVQNVPGCNDVGEAFRRDPHHFVLEVAHHPHAVLPVAVVQLCEDIVPVHAGGDELRSHLESAGIDGIREIVGVRGHSGQEGAGRVGRKLGSVPVDVRQFLQNVVQQFRGGRDVRGGEYHLEAVPLRPYVMVDEYLRGFGSLEGLLQALRAGEAVGVQEDDEVAFPDAPETGLPIRVETEQRDAVRDDETDRGGRGVGQDGDGILSPAFPEIGNEAGDAAQRVPVGVRMGGDRHRNGALEKGVQPLNAVFVNPVQLHFSFAMQKYKIYCFS